MKIAYLTNQYPKVSHAFIRREILALESLGHTIARYSVRPSPDKLTDPDDIAEQKQTTIILNAGVASILLAMLTTCITGPMRFFTTLKRAFTLGRTSSRGTLYHLIYFAEACLLKSRLARDNIQHVHVHFGTNPTTVALFAHWLGGPSYSFTVHGPREFDEPEGIHLGVKIEHAAFVAAITYYCRSQLFRWCDHKHWQKIHIIHCGLDEKFLAAKPTPITDKPRLLTIGRLCEQKAPALIVEALHQLKQQGIDFHHTFAGDGELRQATEALITKHQLQDNITITGWVSADQILDLIQASRCLVLPSFAEGLPVVIMESLALGRPVVSTYIAAIPELVIPQKTGFITSPGSATLLVDQLKAAISADTQTLTAFGQAGRELVLEHHDIKKEARSLAALFAKHTRA